MLIIQAKLWGTNSSKYWGAYFEPSFEHWPWLGRGNDHLRICRAPNYPKGFVICKKTAAKHLLDH